MDEPTVPLDANRAVVVGMVRDANAQGVAVLGIVHDAETRDAVADRLFPLTPQDHAA